MYPRSHGTQCPTHLLRSIPPLYPHIDQSLQPVATQPQCILQCCLHIIDHDNNAVYVLLYHMLTTTSHSSIISMGTSICKMYTLQNIVLSSIAQKLSKLKYYSRPLTKVCIMKCKSTWIGEIKLRPDWNNKQAFLHLQMNIPTADTPHLHQHCSKNYHRWWPNFLHGKLLHVLLTYFHH